MEGVNCAGKEGTETEEVQHQGTYRNFALPSQTNKVIRPAGVVGQRLLGDTEWWGYPVDANMQCMRGAW